MKRNDWRLEPHVCRSCFGRVASHPADDEGGRRLYACTNCGLEADGARVSVLCACGTKIRRGRGPAVDAGLRCHLNLARSLEFPSVYVASYGAAQPES